MPNPKNILVTTTSSIEGVEIKQYLKPISTHIVSGAGFLSDFFASFKDFTGGRSGSYERKLISLYDEAINKLKDEAFEIGANAIIGLNIDFDEISGKAKEMFMISAIGTAVVIQNQAKNISIIEPGKLENVSVERMRNLYKRKRILADASAGTLVLNETNWDFVIENQLAELFDFVMLEMKKTIKSYEYPDNFNKLFQKIVMLLNNLDEITRKELVYQYILKEENELINEKLCSIVEDLLLFDAKNIMEILKLEDFEKQKMALKLVKSNKPFYGKADIQELIQCIELIKEKFPERGIRSMKKQLLSSKEKEVWTCECGRVNDTGSYCYHCNKDIFGFLSNEVMPKNAITNIEERISIIKECLE